MTQKSYYPKEAEFAVQWHQVDAAGKNLGRLATKIAGVLMGKHRPDYTPGVDLGDHVLVTNCEKIAVTGNKMIDKVYFRHSNYTGGLTETRLRRMLRTHPERVLEAAVWGMLPPGKGRRKMIKKLRVYVGAEHPHAPQKPLPLA
ncbi:MAG: 50S ribosomal protein L13 [Anaerolineales bacterium]